MGVACAGFAIACVENGRVAGVWVDNEGGNAGGLPASASGMRKDRYLVAVVLAGCAIVYAFVARARLTIMSALLSLVLWLASGLFLYLAVRTRPEQNEPDLREGVPPAHGGK